MLNLSHFFFLARRYQIIYTSIFKNLTTDITSATFSDDNKQPIAVISLPWSNSNSIKEDYILLLNQKTHFFKFLEQDNWEGLNWQDVTKILYLGMVQHNSSDFVNFNAQSTLWFALENHKPEDEFDEILDIRKNWIYKIRRERTAALRYLFFLKNTKSIEMLINENKNSLFHIFNNSHTLKLLTVCSILGLCLNPETFKKTLLKGRVFVNDKKCTNIYAVIKKYDVVRACLSEQDLDYYSKCRDIIHNGINAYGNGILSEDFKIKKDFEYKQLDHTVVSRQLYAFASNYDAGCFRSLELSPMSFTVFFFKEIKYRNNHSNVFNWSNFRLYSWLISC